MKDARNTLDKNGSKVEFYEDILRSGTIRKGGSAYKRLQKLRGTTDEDKAERLRKFLRKQEEKKRCQVK